MSCPGSVALSEHAPEQIETKWAKEGTAAHAVAEAALSGTLFDNFCRKPEHTDEMYEHSKTYHDYVFSCLEPNGQLLIEHELNLNHLDDRAFGTADAVVVNKTSLVVIDYKYGAGHVVEVEDNPQLLFYALGALCSLKPEAFRRIKEIWMTIVQPRAPHADGVIRDCRISKEDLIEWGSKVLKPAMGRTRDPDAPLAVGDWCRWCPALTICPLQGCLPDKIGAVADFRSPNPALPEPKKLTPEQIGIVLQARKTIEAWLEAVDILARQNLDHGTEIPGWKLVRGKRTRSWANETEAESMLLALYGEEAFTKKLMSVAQAEKRGFEAPYLVSEFTCNSSLVPIDDKRQSVQSSAITDFKEK
jgi:hypothetical protein